MIKLKCVGCSGNGEYFTIGKEYEFNNGTITGDHKFKFQFFKSVDDVIEWFKPWYDFELVEEAEENVITTYSHNGKPYYDDLLTGLVLEIINRGIETVLKDLKVNK